MRKLFLFVFCVISLAHSLAFASYEETIPQPEQNGLKIEISLVNSKDNIYKVGDYFKIKVVFKNISSSQFYVYYPYFDRENFLIAQAPDGKVVKALSHCKYEYLITKDDFHLIKAGQDFTIYLEGSITKNFPVDMYKGFAKSKRQCKAIEFPCIALPICELKSKDFRIYFAFEQGSQKPEFWNDLIPSGNIWTGKTISNPIEITVK